MPNIKNGILKEPFSIKDFKNTCPGFAENTYSTFLSKHCLGNPGGNSVYFERVKEGIYKLYNL